MSVLRSRRILIVVCLGSTSLMADPLMQKAYERGVELGKEGSADMDVTKNKAESLVPKDGPPTSLTPDEIKNAMIEAQKQGYYDFSGEAGLFKTMNEIVENPEKALAGSYVMEEAKEEDLKKCIEHRPPFEVRVRETLVDVTIQERRMTYMGQESYTISIEHGGWDKTWYKEETRYRPLYKYEISTQHLNLEDFSLTEPVWKNVSAAEYTSFKEDPGKSQWKSTHPDFEKNNQGLCQKVSRVCVDGPSKKFIDGHEIDRPCWTFETVYKCGSEGQKTCQELRQKGCRQVSSKPHQQAGNLVISWEQTFNCNKDTYTYKEGEAFKPFCLDGDCNKQELAPNEDMAEALSKIAMLAEVQKDMDHKAGTVFKGNSHHCRKASLGFQECCNSLKGWGKNLGHGCSEDERTLKRLREEGKCQEVGEYCAEKVLGKCVKKKKSYCCFPTKMAAIVQIQGRAQLGIGWGDKKCPSCRGLTFEELSRIDFNRIDLSRLFQVEHQRKMKPKDLETISSQIKKNMQDRIPTPTKPQVPSPRGAHAY